MVRHHESRVETDTEVAVLSALWLNLTFETFLRTMIENEPVVIVFVTVLLNNYIGDINIVISTEKVELVLSHRVRSGLAVLPTIDGNDSSPDFFGKLLLAHISKFAHSLN